MPLLPKAGRPPVVFMMELERELTTEDLMEYATNNALPLKSVPALQRLREIHHRTARLLASGKTPSEVALLVGRSPGRITDLGSDPAFRELIHYYSTQLEEMDLTEGARAKRDYIDINDLAREEILERLENDTKRSQIPIDELRRIMVDTGDRTHSPPKTAVPVVNAPTIVTFNMGKKDLRPKDVSPIIENEDSDNDPD